MTVMDSAPHGLIADLCERLAGEDKGATSHEWSPRRITRALLELEWARSVTGQGPHALNVIHDAFARMVPQERR